jgi:hypothetical protein
MSQVIVRQGSREGTDRFYVIKEGNCVVMRSEQGAYEPKCLMRLEAGAFFGEQSILMGDPHENTVVANSPVTVLWVHMSIFKERFASLTVRFQLLPFAGVLLVCCLCVACVLLVFCLCFACVLLVFCLCFACVLLVFCLCFTCVLLVFCLCFACVLLVFCLSFSQKISDYV